MGTRHPCHSLKTHDPLNPAKAPQDPPAFSRREVILWCLPALLIGLTLRIALLTHMPLAFVSPDTNEFFSSRLFGGSRTFLPKLIYEAPGALGLPLLPSVAVFQHLLGLIMILACGFLCARWLRSWRWWIIPFTCIMAVHPTLLWYEHFALPDSTFTLFLVLACLAGTYFFRRPTAASFGILFASLLLVAGARQEGFLFLAFGVALTIRAFWGDMKHLRVFAPLALVLAGAIAAMTRTNQGGYMLLTSIIQWAPDQVQSDPGLSPRIVKLREHFAARWTAYPDEHNDSRKMIVGEIEDYLASEQGVPEKQLRARTEALCKKLVLETIPGSFRHLPGLVFNKFRASHHESPAPDFGWEWAHDKHLRMFFGKPDGKLPKEHKMMKFYLGREYASREEMERDLPKLYRVFPEDRLSRFQKAFYSWEYGFEVLPRKSIGPQTLPGLPLLYFLAVAGFAVVLVRDRWTLSEKQMWIAMLLLQGGAIFLTGSLRSRYRLSFEPWFFLGVFAFLDFLVVTAKNALGAKGAPKTTVRTTETRSS